MSQRLTLFVFGKRSTPDTNGKHGEFQNCGINSSVNENRNSLGPELDKDATDGRSDESLGMPQLPSDDGRHEGSDSLQSLPPRAFVDTGKEIAMGMGNVGKVVPIGSVDHPHDFWNSLPQGWRDDISDELSRPKPYTKAPVWLVWAISVGLTWGAIFALGYGVDLLCKSVFAHLRGWL